jgi:TatD DNase family protein
MTDLSWIDVAVNLMDRRFDADRNQVVTRARDAGVTTMVVLGCDLESSTSALTQRTSASVALYSTAGIHPHHAERCDSRSLEAIAQLAVQPGVVAVGECGLDFFRDLAPRQRQREAFEAQLELAARIQRPVVIHEREAHGALLELLKPKIAQLPGALLHCFTGSSVALDDYLQLGLYIGVTGWACDERRGRRLLELLPRIPEDRLLLETDAPFLLPRSLRPKPRSGRNEPAYLPHIAETVAQARGASLAQLSSATCANSQRLFQLSASVD